MVPFSNGRHEGANPSSRVIVFPSLESQTFVVDQLYCFRLGVSIPNLKIYISRVTDHTRTEKIGGDFIYLCCHPNRAGNRYDIHKKDFENSRLLMRVMATNHVQG